MASDMSPLIEIVVEPPKLTSPPPDKLDPVLIVILLFAKEELGIEDESSKTVPVALGNVIFCVAVGVQVNVPFPPIFIWFDVEASVKAWKLGDPLVETS